MVVIAVVLDTNNCPISEGFVVEDDDFSEAEEAAETAAENGTKCCIRWNRSSDGQVAYWGPSGAAFKPHWYAERVATGVQVLALPDAEFYALLAEVARGAEDRTDVVATVRLRQLREAFQTVGAVLGKFPFDWDGAKPRDFVAYLSGVMKRDCPALSAALDLLCEKENDLGLLHSKRF